MNRAEELAYILAFVEEACFDEEICCRQLRALWTAYCLHHGLDVDTAGYDSDLLDVWEKVAETEPDTAYWSDYHSFDLYLGDNLC